MATGIVINIDLTAAAFCDCVLDLGHLVVGGRESGVPQVGAILVHRPTGVQVKDTADTKTEMKNHSVPKNLT